MRALSLTRPWTELVLRYGKTIENRTWTTAHRGPVIIHGAQSWSPEAMEYAGRVLVDDEWLQLVGDVSSSATLRSRFPTGLLGTVELVNVCDLSIEWQLPCTCGPWAMPGQYHWRVSNPRPFPTPVPYAGKLGLWTVDDALLLAAAAGTLSKATLSAGGPHAR